MINTTLRRATVLSVGAALLLAGCTDDSSTTSKPTDGATTTPAAMTPSTSATACDLPADRTTALEGVELTGELGLPPTISLKAPVAPEEAITEVYCVGDGAKIAAGQTISLLATTVDAATGEVKYQSSAPESYALNESSFSGELFDALEGATVGTRLLLAFTDTSGDTPVSYVQAVELTGARDVLERAAGETVAPAEGLPTVALDDAGAPTITIPEGYETPADLVVQPLIKGDGAVVDASQTLTVNYTGVKLDGETFDSSWDRGEPATFPLTGVIQGWTEGLAGQTVGSQVLLVIPPSLGYGGNEGHELEKETLVFVVDILDAA